jgi:hypothetical protein
MSKTAYKAKPIPGKKLYQERAAKALPILVRQAHAHCPISYSGLAAELNMPNPRNLNYVLGSVGATISAVSEDRTEPIPPIQALVINQGSRLPGHGFDNFDPGKRMDQLTPRERRLAISRLFDEIYTYPKWPDLLETLSLQPLDGSGDQLLGLPASQGGSGESEAHRRLKHWVAKNPQKVGVSSTRLKTAVEHPILSGDVLDVFFEGVRRWTAIEVKSSKSLAGDLLRGIFQCVKYSAVLEAQAVATRRNIDIQVKLALEDDLPADLRALSNQLGVNVIERVRSAI